MDKYLWFPLQELGKYSMVAAGGQGKRPKEIRYIG